MRWIVLSIALACLLIGVFFCKPLLMGVGESLIVSDPLEKADAIYVLAGDFFGSRVLLGADLGARGFAPLVLLSGGAYLSNIISKRYSGDMAMQYAVEHGYQPGLFQAIRLDDTPSTIDEARAMGPIFQKMGVRRVILVTSNFHSRRAALVFRLMIPDVHFSVAPSRIWTTIRPPGGKPAVAGIWSNPSMKRSPAHCLANQGGNC